MGEPIHNLTELSFDNILLRNLSDEQLAQAGNNGFVPVSEVKMTQITALLTGHKSLLARNRAYFLSVSIAIAGVGFTDLFNLFFLEPIAAAELGKTAILLTILTAVGIMTNGFWVKTTYIRGYNVWFLEALLIHLEKGGICALRYGPVELLTLCSNEQYRMLLKSSSIGRRVVNCNVRATFKFLRNLFISCWWFFAVFSFTLFLLYDKQQLVWLLVPLAACVWMYKFLRDIWEGEHLF